MNAQDDKSFLADLQTGRGSRRGWKRQNPSAPSGKIWNRVVAQKPLGQVWQEQFDAAPPAHRQFRSLYGMIPSAQPSQQTYAAGTQNWWDERPYVIDNEDISK